MKRREPEEYPEMEEILGAARRKHPAIRWELIAREINGSAVYKLVGERGEIRTSERIEAHAMPGILKANAESAARVVADRIARIEKKNAA